MRGRDQGIVGLLLTELAIHLSRQLLCHDYGLSIANILFESNFVNSRLPYTAAACQHPSGGFGGGHGQDAHIAPSYAIVLALAMVGGQEAADVVNRKTMYGDVI